MRIRIKLQFLPIIVIIQNFLCKAAMISSILCVWKRRSILRSILPSLLFNFYYLPFKQAIKLPILLYKPKFICLKGKIQINGPIFPGMICLGFNRVNVYPNNGISWENRGGVVIFEGTANIGNNSFISVGEKGILSIGLDFSCNSSLKCVCWNKITIGEHTRVGWDVLFLDTSFHRLKCESGYFGKGYGTIEIGANNWISTKCTVLSGAKTSNWTVAAACSLLNKSIPENRVLVGGSPAKILRTGVWRDISDDMVEIE